MCVQPHSASQPESASSPGVVVSNVRTSVWAGPSAAILTAAMTVSLCTSGRPAQSSARLRIVAQAPEGEAGAPDAPRTAEPAEPRQARILPDLLSHSRAEELPNPEAERRPARRRKPQTPRPQERIAPETEKLPGCGQMLVLDADRDHR